MPIQYNRWTLFHTRLFAFLLGIAGIVPPVSGQITIDGPTCVIAGTQYTYTISGAWNGSYTMNWSSTGAISGSSTGTGLAQVHITWNSGTSGNVNLNMVDPSTGQTTFAPQLNVNINPAFTVGAILSGTPQNNPNNTIPANITCSQPSGGSCGTPNYTYQWQQSTDNNNFATISGATTQTLTFSSGLTSTHYYRCLQAETTSGSSGYTGSATVFVYPKLIPGTITPGSATINYNRSPGLLTLGGYGGGTGTDTLQWQNSLDNVNWGNISGATAATYSPGNLTVTTYFRVLVTSASAAYSDTVVFTVNPEVFPGVITPSNTAIPSGTIPGLLSATKASGGACSGAFAYQWQSSTDDINYTSVTGATGLSYLPGTLTATTYYRLRVICATDTEYTAPAEVAIVAALDKNYVCVRDLRKPGVTDSLTAAGLSSPYDVTQTTQYFDGLSRLIQTVAMQQTPLQKDFVSINVYDDYGRETNKYLPFADTSSSGNYKYSALADQYTFNAAQFPGEQFYYGLVNFEPSPLNRPLTSEAPGMSWAGSARGVSEQHLVNQPADSVRLWTIAYPVGSIPTSTATYAPGTLYKDLTADEAGHMVVTYKDLQGQVILKKVQVAAPTGTAHVGWLCTYYVYDDMAHLRFVIQPQAVVLIDSSWSISTTIANELCFRYEYDIYGRMNIKKVPGAGEVHMVYDVRDRLVMSQDSNLRAQKQWLFTCYDALNRGDSTGLMTDTANYNYLTFHTTAALQSATYPNLASYTVQLMTRNFYDDYKWVAANSAPVLSAFDASHSTSSSWFITSYNTSPTYAVPITPIYITRGMQTGVAKIIIGSTSQYMYTSMFYDDRGRVIQTSSNNYGLGKDTVTNQYNFTGKVLRSLHGHSRVANTAQSHMIMTQMDYDHVNRLNHIYKLIDNPSSIQLIARMQYDELGQLKVKNLGNSLDSLTYTYNIRGWLTGINKNYVGGTTHNSFGMELAYDNATSITGTTYATPQYNGNIAGVIWKSSGDAINRKYDFTYDTVNRLTGANFNQYIGGTWGKSSGGSRPVTIDFSVSGLGYDANGNIQSMIQQGFKIGGTGTPIDSLTYTYTANSNKLLQVHDEYNDTASVLGDFHYKGVKGSADYSYDGNGNLANDNNKGLNNFTYNYLNLLANVHVNGKGLITYIYDAGGTKLEKQVSDSTTSLMTFTDYLGEFQYTRRAPFSNITAGSDTLQFITTEEGRARWAFHKHVAGDTITYPEYDFVERDHLGNERVLLTQERDTTQYIATMEAANRATENALFYNIGTTCVARTSVPAPGYPNDTSYSSPNDSVVRLNGNGPTVGPAIILKVMSGDLVDVGTQFYYNSGTYTSSPPISAQNLLNSLASGLATISSAASENITTLTNPTSSPLLAALTSSINNDTATGTTKPQAYVNWVLLDKQFRYVAGSSGAMQVGAAGQSGVGGLQPPLIQRNIPMYQSGYLYIYVSNATKGWDVFFDNMSVHLYTRQLLEENNYYPFGLTMAGISDKAIKTQYATNKYRYNGKELQNQEFADGSGLEEYDYGARMQDPQLGVWHGVDPLADHSVNWSPFNYALNNPLRYIDPDGTSEEDDILNADPNGIRGHFEREMNGTVGSAQDFEQRAQQDQNSNSMQSDNSGGNPAKGLTPTDRKIAAEAWKMIITGDLEGAIKHIISSYPAIFYLNKNITWTISAQGRGNINTTDQRGRQAWSNGPNGEKLLLLGTDFGRNPMHNFVAGTVDYAAIVRGALHEYVHVLNAYSSFGHMEDNEDEFRAHYASITNPFLPAYSPYYMRFYLSKAENYYNQIPAQNRTPELQRMYGELEEKIKPKYYP